MTDIATLGLKVDSSEVARANTNLDKFEKTAQKAEKAAADLGKTSETAAQSVARNAGALGDITAELDAMSSRVLALRADATATTVAAESLVGVAVTAGAAAAVVAVLTKAYVDGARESEVYARAIAATGNAAGLTVDRLSEMAARIDDVVGTQANASKALATLASTGDIAADNLERFATIAIQLERTVGTPIAETAKRFADLAKEPAKAAAQLQKTYGFLTPAIYATIRAQEEAGQVAAAGATAQGAYADAALKGIHDVEGELNVLGKAWRGITSIAGETWDAMSGIGRRQTLEKQLAELESLQRNAPRSRNTANIDAEIEHLQALIAARDKDAAAAAEQKKEADGYIQSLANAAKFEDVWKRINSAWDTFDAAKVREGLAGILGEFNAAENTLEAQHSARLIADTAYYAKRRELVEKNVDAEITALRRESAELAKLPKDNFSVEGIQRQAKIGENEARISQLRTRAAGQLHVLEIQQQADLDKTARTYSEAQESAARYVETLTKRFAIESQGLGLGEEARRRLQDEASLLERFQDRRQELDRDKRRGDITEETYQKLLAIEESALHRSEAAYDDHYKALKEKQGSWLVGAQEAFANFRDSSANVASQVDQAFSRAFDGIADSITQFAMTGKLSLKDLVNSFLADLLRIEVKIIESKVLASIFGSVGSSGDNPVLAARFGSDRNIDINFPQPRASGGPISAGSPYLVGENGPEIVVPNSPGWVLPNGSGGRQLVMHNVWNFGANSSVATMQGMVEQGLARLENKIYQNLDRGRWRRVTG